MHSEMKVDGCTQAKANGHISMMSVPWEEPPSKWNDVLVQDLGGGWVGCHGARGMGTNTWVSGFSTSCLLSWERFRIIHVLQMGKWKHQEISDLSKILQQSWDVFPPRKYAFSMVYLITEGSLLAHSSHVYKTQRLTVAREAGRGGFCGFVRPWGAWGLYQSHTSLSLLNQSPPLGGCQGRDFYLGKYPWWFWCSPLFQMRMVSAGPWCQRWHANWIGPDFGLAEGPGESSDHLKL